MNEFQQQSSIAASHPKRVQPAAVPSQRPRRVVRTVRRQKRKSFYSLKTLVFATAAALFVLMFMQLYFDNQISRLHIETESIRAEIVRQSSENEQLSSTVSELSRYSRVMEIAERHGLSYQDNIIRAR